MQSNEGQGLLTKFYYQDNYLHYQILIQTETGMQVFGEYSDFSEYQTAFISLQRRLIDKTITMVFPEKAHSPETILAKVA
jgi:hypothetical protein